MCACFVMRIFVLQLTDERLANKRLIHCTSCDLKKRSNAAYLMVAFCIIILGWSPEAACKQFEELKPPLLGFRDATYGSCSYRVSLSDCAMGLNRAISVREHER